MTSKQQEIKAHLRQSGGHTRALYIGLQVHNFASPSFPGFTFRQSVRAWPYCVGFSYRLCAASFRWFCYFRQPGCHDAHLSEHFRPCGFASPTFIGFAFCRVQSYCCTGKIIFQV